MLILLILGFITFGLRFVPHIPNFSPVIAFALLSGLIWKDRKSIVVPFAVVVLSDLIIGVSDVAFFVWSSILLIGLFSRFIRKNIWAVCGYSLASSVFYFILTNLGVWLMGWYPYTLWGLHTCYLRAIPFFRAQIVSTLVFSVLFYVAFEIVTAKFRIPAIKSVLYKR